MGLAKSTGRKKIVKISPSGHRRTNMSGYIFATLRHVSTIGKKMLDSDMSPIYPHNMVNFGQLAAEIGSVVWGQPIKFQRVSRLGFVTARHSSSGRQPNFAALNRGRKLYSAGWPSC